MRVRVCMYTPQPLREETLNDVVISIFCCRVFCIIISYDLRSNIGSNWQPTKHITYLYIYLYYLSVVVVILILLYYGYIGVRRTRQGDLVA